MNLTTVLRYNPETGRMAIGERDLHCGDCFQLMAASDPNGDPVWYNVQIEHASDGWYLIGLPMNWQADALCFSQFHARFHP